MNALVSELSQNELNILSDALEQVYGEGNVEVIQVSNALLRQRVRLATTGNGSIDTVLIVLNKESYEKCKDMKDDLQKSDKFYLYENENGLIGYLNEKFNLSIDLKEVQVAVEGNIIKNEEYESRIDYLNKMVENLTYQVKDLENALEEGGYNNYPTVEDDNSEGKYTEEYIESIKSEYSDKVSVLEKEREELKNSLENLEETKKTILFDLESVRAELQDYKIKYSTQTGLINSKEREISQLKSKVEELSKSLVEKDLSGTEVSALKESIEESQRVISDYKEKNLAQEEAIKSLSSELNETKETLKSTESSLKNSLNSEKQEKEKLQSDLSECKNRLSAMKGMIENNNSLKEEVSNLRAELKNSESTVLELNKQKIEMQERLEVLEKSTSRDTDIETIMSELSSLRQQYDKLQLSTYSKISEKSNPQDSLNVNLLKEGNLSYKNIMFAFAGSTESRKGMYKSLLSKVSQLPETEKVILVDVVSETSIDYVFEIKFLKSGLTWFNSGGSFEECLSSTCLSNVHVLSIGGTGYINDSYFLEIDWSQRLQELENSGYKVILICGDISNMIGRVLHESFASLGSSKIYVHGNAVGSRSVITNIRGLSNAKDSTICYFEFNKQVQKYVDIASKICKCEVIGML